MSCVEFRSDGTPYNVRNCFGREGPRNPGGGLDRPGGGSGGGGGHGGANSCSLEGGDPSEWKVYECKRPLGGEVGGDKKNGPDWIPINPLYHQFLCVKKKNGEIICRGLNPSGSRALSPGTFSDKDKFHEKNCNEVSSDECTAKCVKKQFKKPLPPYGVGPQATDCQEWVQDILNKCISKCQNKENGED